MVVRAKFEEVQLGCSQTMRREGIVFNVPLEDRSYVQLQEQQGFKIPDDEICQLRMPVKLFLQMVDAARREGLL